MSNLNKIRTYTKTGHSVELLHRTEIPTGSVFYVVKTENGMIIPNVAAINLK